LGKNRQFFRKKAVWMISVGLLIIFSFIGYWWLKERPSDERVEYFSGEYPILYSGNQEGNAVKNGEQLYAPFEFFTTHLDGLLHYDIHSESMILTTQTHVLQIPVEKNYYSFEDQQIETSFPSVKKINNQIYISLDFITNFYPMQVSVLPDSSAVLIETKNREIQYGKIKDTDNEDVLRLRKSNSLLTPYVSEAKPGDRVMIEGEKEDYYYIRLQDGSAGYILKKWVEKTTNEKMVVSNPYPPYKRKEAPSPIQLVWEAVYSYTPDPSQLPHMPGINVVSPTWFHLKDGEGNLQNLASNEYVNWAKENNQQVWALFSNNFDPDLTHEALSTYSTRQKIIRQLVSFADQYKLDGLNVDIENVYLQDGPYVTQFMRELTPVLHQKGLIVSMDITFISDSETWSRFYEREKLVSVVDYFVVMAYDEHTNSSEQAGSVASLPWVEGNLQRLLEIIPNEKLILGVPLYTRLWKEYKDENGKIQLTSEALTMDAAEKWVKEKSLTPTLDEETGQLYVEYYDDQEDVRYKMWLEERNSLTQRIQLAQQYQLAGVAGWSRYFGNDIAWASFDQLYVTNDEE